MTPSHRSARGQVQPLVAVALGVVAVVGLAAAVLVSRPGAADGPRPSDRPSTPPGSAPVASPMPSSPSPSATPTPTADPSAGIGTIDLRSATGHDVTAQIHDQTGDLVKAASGAPGDGMSVRWHDALVANAGSRTIFVTWAGLPKDDVLDLGVAIVDGRLQVTVVQAGPVPNSDAMGEDRVIALTFDRPVAAADVSVEILDRTVD
jgi:hypothetical protein